MTRWDLVSAIAVCVATSTACANEAAYHYDWGTLVGYKQEGRWVYGRVDASVLPRIFVRVNGKGVALSKIDTRHVVQLGATVIDAEAENPVYVLEGLAFEFDGRRLAKWSFGPAWGKKGSTMFGKGANGPWLALPLIDDEIEKLFGEPMSVRRSVAIN